eukprot:gene6418-4618_t
MSCRLSSRAAIDRDIESAVAVLRAGRGDCDVRIGGQKRNAPPRPLQILGTAAPHSGPGYHRLNAALPRIVQPLGR